jgi:hypothetical protein
MSRSILYLGMDVHKESVTIAVLPGDAAAPAMSCSVRCAIGAMHAK